MTKPDGLYPNFLNPTTGNWGTSEGHAHYTHTLTPSPLPSFTCHTYNHTSLSSTPPSHHLSPPHTTLTTSPLHVLHSRPYLFSIICINSLTYYTQTQLPFVWYIPFWYPISFPPPPPPHTHKHTHAHSTHRTNFHGSIGWQFLWVPPQVLADDQQGWHWRQRHVLRGHHCKRENARVRDLGWAIIW